MGPFTCILVYKMNFCGTLKLEYFFQDALIGFSLELKHLDGHAVSITRDKVTWPGARIRKKGEGMPNYDNNNLQGTLYITFDVDFPKNELSEQDKEGVF